MNYPGLHLIPCSYSDGLLDKLVTLNKNATNKVNIDEVAKAIYYAKKYHSNQTRHSGQPYYIHPISVATIVSDYLLDTAAIVVALLHDTVEDSKVFNSHIKMLFNEEIASLVDQLSKVSTSDAIKMKLSKEESALKVAHFSKKALIVKLADRLDNMRTIDNIPSLQKRKRIATETLQIFVPLAQQIGLITIGHELMTLSLKTLRA